MPKVGVFVCHCGSNIAGTVDCPGVAEQCKSMPGVVFSTDFQYMCSESGQNLIEEAVTEHDLDRVVVASCSPRMHEPTFRKAAARAGLNPFYLEMANIREHCSWVHPDKEVGTQKAQDIIRMQVSKVLRNSALTPQRAPLTKKLLVIGGGIAGIQAALDVAKAGYQVTLVEKTATIGGKMAMLDKTFPTLDCSACILTPLMVEVAQHPNITLYTYSEVEDVHGFVGNFDVTIRRKASYVDHDLCTGCGICWSKCPNKKVPSEFDQGMGTRTSIYIPFPQAIPNKPVIDESTCRYIAYREAARDLPEGEKPRTPEGKPMPECRICEKMCPTKSIKWDDEDELITDRYGAIIVATGYDLFDHSVYGEYGHGKLEDVVTGLQLERMMNASGPSHGHVLRPSNGEPPRSVVFLACVGSRDEKVGQPYCSKICCMYIAKQAVMLKEHDPDVQTYVFYIDVRAGGKGYEEFIRRAQEQYDVVYTRGRVSRIYKRADGQLVVQGTDTLMGKPIEIETDLVVLATGVVATHDAKELMQTLSISYDNYGFINEVHVKLRPVETNTDGIYLAGTASGPKDIPDSVAQASAAAVKVCGLFSGDYIETDPQTAVVDQNNCVGCFLCEEVCPFNAVQHTTLRNGKEVAEINPAVCKGCGLCVAGCRGKCITLKGFTDQQLLAEVMGLLKAPAPDMMPF